MEFRVFVEPQQGADYDQLVSMAKESERLGFDAFFRSDHYLKMGDASGLPGPTDAWLTLAGIARETERIRLGTLVTSATFRLPGALAISVAQVDQMSQGRVELGLGAGWYEAEHAAYGIAFPALKERFERLEEQLAIVTGLWTTPEGSTFTHDGAHYRLADSPALPKTVQQPHPPVIVGGVGASRTPRLAATYATEFNAPFLQPDDAKAAFERVDAACEEIGRDPGTITRSCAVTVCCASDPTTLTRRIAAMGWDESTLRAAGACGTPDEVAVRLVQWRDAGARRIYLQVLDVDDHEHLEEIMAACRLAGS